MKLLLLFLLFPQATLPLSRSFDGSPLTEDSRVRGVSTDGSRVLVESTAPNLVAGDTNGRIDVFLVDAATALAARVSIGANGEEGDGPSDRAAMSPDGRFVGFQSDAMNLVPGDGNGATDVFVRDVLLGTTARVSLRDDGSEIDLSSNWAALSSDGRHVAFDSIGTGITADDANVVNDVFVRDRDPDGNGVFDEGNGRTLRISVSAIGATENGGSYFPAMSHDGRFVTFHSIASNLVSGDGNQAWDVFVHDRDPDGNGVLDEGNGLTSRMSVSTNGREGNADSRDAAISGNGRYAAFWSDARTLIVGDTNGLRDVFVRDLVLGRTARMSVGTDREQADGESRGVSLSADGRYLAFRSAASNLVPGDTNGVLDLFVRDRDPDGDGTLTLGTIRRVSLTSFDREIDGDADFARLGADGRYLAFGSVASRLLDPGVTPGVFASYRRDLMHLRVSGAADRLRLDVLQGHGHEGRTILLALSVTGTSPGTRMGSLTVPVVFDQATRDAWSVLPTFGVLGPDGETRFVLPLVGAPPEIHAAAVVLEHGVPVATTPPISLRRAWEAVPVAGTPLPRH